MNSIRKRIPLFLTMVTCATVAFPVHATTESCTFRGEIVYAEDYGKIVIDRADSAGGDQPLGPHSPLYPGDVLVVQADQVVWIRDEPRGKLREITAGDGRVTIGQPESCDVRKGFDLTFDDLKDKLEDILGGPVADQPIATYPRRGDSSASGLELAFAEEQMLTADTDLLSVSWTGTDADVALRSTADDTVLIDGSSSGVPLFEGLLERPLKSGEVLRLEIETESGRAIRTVRVVPRGDLPRPTDIQSLDDLTSTEATIYAVWLATEGPPDWHLQGMSLLAQAARDNYMAWKVLRRLRSGPLE